MEYQQEFSAPCQCCGEDVPESEAHGDADTEYLCSTCPSKGVARSTEEQR